MPSKKMCDTLVLSLEYCHSYIYIYIYIYMYSVKFSEFSLENFNKFSKFNLENFLTYQLE